MVPSRSGVFLFKKPTYYSHVLFNKEPVTRHNLLFSKGKLLDSGYEKANVRNSDSRMQLFVFVYMCCHSRYYTRACREGEGGGCFSLVWVKVLRLYHLLEIVKLSKAHYISTVGDTLHYTLCAIYFHPHSLHVTWFDGDIDFIFVRV